MTIDALPTNNEITVDLRNMKIENVPTLPDIDLAKNDTYKEKLSTIFNNY